MVSTKGGVMRAAPRVGRETGAVRIRAAKVETPSRADIAIAGQYTRREPKPTPHSEPTTEQTAASPGRPA